MEWSRVTTARGISCRVLTGGAGPDLVWWHPTTGLRDGDALLARLASRFRVVAPELPGYGESEGAELLEDMLDFTLHGWDVVETLGLDRPVLAGHSMGGMLAAEMACLCPGSIDRLVLVAPLGLWLDEQPVPDLFAMTPHSMPKALFHDAGFGEALLTGGVDFGDDRALAEFFIGNAKRMGMAGKILFPIPDRRLSKRLYRLRASTLLVWGDSDRMLPAPYASAWSAAIPGAAVKSIADAGHMVAVERPDETASAIEAFAGGG